MTTGQYPKRRETDEEVDARVTELQRRAEKNKQRAFSIKIGSFTWPPKITASGRLMN
jgi:hypothetical protein